MPKARHVPGLDAMACNTAVTKEGLMAIDMTGSASDFGVQDGVLHAGLLGVVAHMASGLKSATLSAPVSPAREKTS